MDSVDIYHGLSGHLPWTQWTFTMDSVDSLDNVHRHWTKSSESMDKVQWDQPDWTMSMDSVDTVHGQWTLSMDSVDSQDIIHGHPGQSPGRLDNVHGQSPLSSWTDWTLSMDSLDFVKSVLVKKNWRKVASLEIYIQIFLSKQFWLFELITSNN